MTQHRQLTARMTACSIALAVAITTLAALALVSVPRRAAAAGTFGYQTVGAAVGNLDVYAYGTRFTAPVDLSITSVTVYVVTTDSSSSLKVAAYDESLNLLGSGSTSVEYTTGTWKTVSLTAATGTITSGSTVMLAARADAGTGSLKGRYDAGSVGQSAYSAVTYAAFPESPFNVGANQDRVFSIYADYADVTPTPTDTPVSAPTDTSTPTPTGTATTSSTSTSTPTPTNTPLPATPTVTSTPDATSPPGASRPPSATSGLATTTPSQPPAAGQPPASEIERPADPANGGAPSGVVALPDAGSAGNARGSGAPYALLAAIASGAAVVALCAARAWRKRKGT